MCVCVCGGWGGGWGVCVNVCLWGRHLCDCGVVGVGWRGLCVCVCRDVCMYDECLFCVSVCASMCVG